MFGKFLVSDISVHVISTLLILINISDYAYILLMKLKIILWLKSCVINRCERILRGNTILLKKVILNLLS